MRSIWPTAISTEPLCTQLTPSSAIRARRERTHPIGVNVAQKRATILDPLENNIGHQDAFPRPRLSARFRFSQGTLAGTRNNGRNAPIADRGGLKRGRQQSTLLRHWPLEFGASAGHPSVAGRSAGGTGHSRSRSRHLRSSPAMPLLRRPHDHCRGLCARRCTARPALRRRDDDVIR
jgi:hypothetical protein